MKKSTLLRVSAIAVSLAFVTAACGSDSDSSVTEDTVASEVTEDTAAAAVDGVTCEGVSIAFFGALSGDAGNLGKNIRAGADLAVSEFNTANPDCQVGLVDFDSQGDPAQAPALAQKAIDDAGILGIVGPAFSGESKAANPLFDAAGLAIITPSATNADLNDNNWKVFHRALAGDDKQGPAIATYIQKTLAAAKVGVIDDASEYGKGLADIVKTTLGDAVVASDSIDPKAADFSAAVSKMKEAAPDAIFYGGYYAEAGKLAKQLRDAGVTATLVFGDGVKDQAGYADAAGPAAEGALIACPCKDGSADFTAAWQAANGEVPGTYGAEYYDAANVLLNIIKAGAKDRAAVLAAVKAYDAPGITKQIKFTANGEATEASTIYMYKVTDGKITYVADIK